MSRLSAQGPAPIFELGGQGYRHNPSLALAKTSDLAANLGLRFGQILAIQADLANLANLALGTIGLATKGIDKTTSARPAGLTGALRQTPL